MFRSQKHPVVLEKRYLKVLSQWGCHKVTEMSRVVGHLGVQLARFQLYGFLYGRRSVLHKS